MTCLRLLPSIRLYQYAICPFCHKSKALLNYIGLEHDIVEVNPLTKAELPKTDYRKVPIALIDQQQVNGSDEIVQSLLENQRVQEKLKLDKWKDTGMTLDLFQGNDDDNQRKWMQFARERVATTLYPNICRTMGDSYESFGYVNDVSSWSTLQKMYVRTIGSFAMYMAASRIKKKNNIEDEQGVLQEVLQQWHEVALASGQKRFASGLDAPGLADVTVYGSLRSVEGLKTHDDFVLNGPIKEWYQRMKTQTNNH